MERSQYSLAPTYSMSVTPGADFRQKYGDYFVAGYRGASSLFVVYQCRFATTEQRTKFTATMAAKVPEVVPGAEGSIRVREKTAKESSASISIRIEAQGVSTQIPSAPAGGWTPAAIVTDLLPWFEKNQAPNPLDAYLMHYRLIDPAISGEVPISPTVFAQLGFLYDRFWLARALWSTCPDFGRRLVDVPYNQLAKDLEAHQASLASDSGQIKLLTNSTRRCSRPCGRSPTGRGSRASCRPRPRQSRRKSVNFDADKGRVRWGYGFQQVVRPGVTISGIPDSVEADWHIGWREHVFTFRDTTKIIVGWDVICNWTDGTGGDWKKASDTIIGENTGAIYVKSDYDRGYSWTVIWYVVDAALYPSRG